MDDAAFEPWLVEIGRLSASQRRRAWEALALSEVSGDGAADLLVATDARHASAAAAVAKRLPAVDPSKPIDADVVSALGQNLVDREGCPHCDSHEVVRC